MRREIEKKKKKQKTEPSFVYTTTTNAIKVSAQPIYLDEHSSATERQYVWAYKILIENYSKDSVQLLGRRWCITDCNGLSQEVEGPGVVGEQPVIKPGEQFEYASFTSLSTPSGIMAGCYQMTSPGTDQIFDVAIPAFSLDSPDQIMLPN